MKKLLPSIIKAQDHLMGINRRNIEYVYPLNPRKEQKLANDKVLSKTLLEEHGIPVPKTFAIIEHLWQLDRALEQLKELETFVVKPARGSGGNGILILQRDGKGWVSPDGTGYPIERLRMHIAGILYGAYSHDQADKAIVEERLAPHDFFRNIYDTGIPDVRVIVHRNIPVMAMLRVPTLRSKGKANLHQGALGIGIDLESGCLGYGFHKNRKVRVHPDSGVPFSGLEIPEWKKFLSVSSLAARLVPLKYLGVDIISDELHGPLVIEINARPGLQIQNSNSRGLLEVLVKDSSESL